MEGFTPIPNPPHAALGAANTVDMSRRSPTYETRLAKYAARGFSVEVPALQRQYVGQAAAVHAPAVSHASKIFLLIMCGVVLRCNTL